MEIAEKTNLAGIDRHRVAAWASDIARDDLAAVRESFRARGARGPEVVWGPSIDRIETGQLRFLLAYWSRISEKGRMPRVSDIDPLDMRPALGYVMLLDVVDGGRDFRYRLFGSNISAVSEFDMTGRLLSKHEASAYIVEFGLAVYQAALARAIPVLTEHWPAGTRVTSSWQRLVLPLANEAGEIVRFLTGTVPLRRDGTVVLTRF